MLQPAKLEAPARAALEEAAFKLVKDAHAGGGRPGAYFGAYLHWLQRGLPVAQAYVERSGIHARALCFVQALPLCAATSLSFARQACAATSPGRTYVDSGQCSHACVTCHLPDLSSVLLCT